MSRSTDSQKESEREYRVNKVISSDKNIMVFLGYYRNNQVVIKLFNNSKIMWNRYQNELRILKYLNECNFDFTQKLIAEEIWQERHVDQLVEGFPEMEIFARVRFRGVYPVIVSDYCGKDVYYHLIDEERRFTTDKDKVKFIAEAVEELAVKKLPLLAKAGIIHGDIKAENITYKDGKCYLIDFGSSYLEGEEPSNEWNRCTYPYYIKNQVNEKRAIALVIYFITHRSILPPSFEKPIPWFNSYCESLSGYEYVKRHINLLD